MRLPLLKLYVFALFFLIGILSTPVYAGLLLSVNPIEGGNGIRFERVLPGLKNTRQVQVRINSNDGTKYQVFQRVDGPVINDKGQPLNLSAIQTVSLVSSNSSGTLYMQNADRLSYSEQLLYTSGQKGESDSFMVAYNVVPQLVGGSGNYRGRVVFTVRAMGAGGQSESVVDLFLEGSSHLQVSVSGGRDLKRIHVEPNDRSQEKADFSRISFSNNGSGDIKIYQEFSSMFNELNNELPLDALRISIEGTNSGNVRSVDALSRKRTLIYSGIADADDLVVYFLVDPQKLQVADAGKYVGKVKYTIETSAATQEFILDIDCEVKPIFTIDVGLPPEGVSFGHVLAASPGQEKEVRVVVHSNLRKPYQVLQNVPSLLTNKQGQQFDKSHFNFKVVFKNPDQKGRTRYKDFASVETGEYPIYASDAQGGPVEFVVVFQLQGYLGMPTGDFVAPVRISLNQN